MSSNQKSVFISYSWKDERIIDEIDIVFYSIGLPLKRDKRELKYKSSIKEFMETIRKTDFVLMVVSDNFLKAQNCMYEVLELVKDDNYKDKLLQILLPNTNIFKPIDKIKYIKYWNNQYDKLKKRIHTLKTTDSIPLIETLKHLENIKATIGEFLNFLSNENALTYDELVKTDFKVITDKIGHKSPQLLQPKRIKADLYEIGISGRSHTVIVGIYNNKPYELFCIRTTALLDFREPTSPASIVYSYTSSGTRWMDLHYDSNGFPVEQKKINIAASTDIYIYLDILNYLLKNDMKLEFILDILDKMFTSDFDDPYIWKAEMKKILLNYIS